MLRSPGAPKEIAGGLAVGLFVAFLPGFQMPMAVGLAALIGLVSGLRLSKVAAAAGVWLTNPVTGGPLYGLAFLIGRPITRFLTGSAPDSLPPLDLKHLAALGPVALQSLLALLLGGIVVGIPVAIAGYRASIVLVRQYQERRSRRASFVRRPVLAPVVVAAD